MPELQPTDFHKSLDIHANADAQCGVPSGTHLP